MFIEDIDAAIYHSLQDYWASHRRVDLTDITFRGYYLPAIQEVSDSVSYNNELDNLEKLYRKYVSQRALLIDVNVEPRLFLLAVRVTILGHLPYCILIPTAHK